MDTGEYNRVETLHEEELVGKATYIDERLQHSDDETERSALSAEWEDLWENRSQSEYNSDDERLVTFGKKKTIRR